jgi:hypothetical protein
MGVDIGTYRATIGIYVRIVYLYIAYVHACLNRYSQATVRTSIHPTIFLPDWLTVEKVVKQKLTAIRETTDFRYFEN